MSCILKNFVFLQNRTFIMITLNEKTLSSMEKWNQTGCRILSFKYKYKCTRTMYFENQCTYTCSKPIVLLVWMKMMLLVLRSPKKKKLKNMIKNYISWVFCFLFLKHSDFNFQRSTRSSSNQFFDRSKSSVT